MNDAPLPWLDADALLRLATGHEAAADSACPACASLVCPGWESLSASIDASALRRVGRLHDLPDGGDEPTLAEYHPAGTHGWSAEAPIAPAWFPYNRCELWQCGRCARPFLRYTEYGGYYVDERIRALQSHLLVDVPAA